MGSTGHLSVQQGKRVLVHTKTGDSFIAKFKTRLARHVTFYDAPPIRTDKIRTLSIYKSQPPQSKEKK